MKRTLPLSIAFAAAVTCCASTISITAHADPPQPSGAATGWAVAAVSVVLGGSITGLSLTIDCHEQQGECARVTSYVLWSGVGVASIGAVVGLLMVRAATPSPRVRVSVGVDPARGAPPAPHATFVYAF